MIPDVLRVEQVKGKERLDKKRQQMIELGGQKDHEAKARLGYPIPEEQNQAKPFFSLELKLMEPKKTTPEYPL